MAPTALVSVLLVTLSASCAAEGTSGSGPVVSEARHVAAFTHLVVGNGIELTVQVGEAQGLSVLAQDNVLPLIATTVQDAVLTIRSSASYATDAGVTVVVSMPSLEGVAVSGGSVVQIDDWTSDRADIDMSGGSRLAANGAASDVGLIADGGSRADLSALNVRTMTVELSGGSTADLNVSERVTGTADGGAAATMTGGAEQSVQTSGGATVTSP